MSKLLKDLNRIIADMWVAGKAGIISCDNPNRARAYIWVYSGSELVYAFDKYRYKAVMAAIKGAGWNTRHAQAIGAGLRKHPIHVKAMDATSDRSIVTYIDKRGHARHVRMEAGMNTPAVMLYLAYRRYSNRLNRQLESLKWHKP